MKKIMIKYLLAAIFAGVALTLSAQDVKILKKNTVLLEKPVQGDVKYHLTFSAAQSGRESIEENPTLYRHIANASAGTYPVCRLVFLDEAGKKVSSDTRVITIPFAEMKQHDCVFYAPRKAVKVQVLFQIPKDLTLKVTAPELKEETAEKTVNINPKFDLGIYNYSGWSGFNDGSFRMVNDENGKTHFFSGFYAISSKYPLKDEKYLLTWEGNGYERGRVIVILLFYDAEGKKLHQLELPRLNKKHPRAEYRFKRPENAAYIAFWVYHATLAEISLVPEK